MKDKHFKLILEDEGMDVYMPRDTQDWGYRYGPSIMVHDGIAEAWFATPGDGYEADWFSYRRSEDGGKTWSYEKVMMAPTPDSIDWFSVCDPGVIKYGDYYYIGYTSTLFADGGGVGNNAYVARSKSPTGPFEKWNGNGWGEHRETEHGTYHWIGQAAPVVYFDGEWRDWGIGEFSFVVVGTTLYMYYTRTRKNLDGVGESDTCVATADITDENWPASIVDHGVAFHRDAPGMDSMDVVYCEDLEKFIGLSTASRFHEDSFLAVFESDDGLRFRRVNDIREKTRFMCHNCGISGDELHHIKSGDLMILGYAYGNLWGNWGTHFHTYRFEAMDEDYYSEINLPCNCAPMEKWPKEEHLDHSCLTMAHKHYIRVYVGEEQPIDIVTFNVCYDRAFVYDAVFSNYDTEIVEICGTKVIGKKPGYTYVDATLGDLSCQFLIYVREKDNPFDDNDRTLISFTPMQKNYTVSMEQKEKKQIRGTVRYRGGYWYETGEQEHGVSFTVSDPAVIAMDEKGIIHPKKTGSTVVTVTCGNISFDVNVTVISETPCVC